MHTACWHHDDFLFDKQFPTTEQPKESPITAGDELLERFSRRLVRLRTSFTLPQPQPSKPRPGVVGIDISRNVAAAFQSVWKDFPAKHPPRRPGQSTSEHHV
jgi:hypothetical protein